MDGVKLQGRSRQERRPVPQQQRQFPQEGWLMKPEPSRHHGLQGEAPPSPSCSGQWGGAMTLPSSASIGGMRDQTCCDQWDYQGRFDVRDSLPLSMAVLTLLMLLLSTPIQGTLSVRVL
jgi:hypothetical protein